MDDLLILLQGAWPLTVTGLVGLGLQVVALVLAIRAGKRTLPPLLLSVLSLLALLVVCHVMVQGRWEIMTSAVSGADPATRMEMLAKGILTSIQVFFFGALCLLIQAPIAAIAVGFALARRARAKALAYVGVALAGALFAVAPLGLGVVSFVLRWHMVFGALGGADPATRGAMLVAGMEQPQAVLLAMALMSAGGLMVTVVLAMVLAGIQARAEGRAAGPPRAGAERPALVWATAAVCVAASVGLWVCSRSYVLPPADGPVKRYLEATKLPIDLVNRLKKDSRYCEEQAASLSAGDDMHPPISSAPTRCEQELQITLTRRAILVEGESVAAVKGGSVDAAIKRDGASGYLIDPLLDQLSKHATRLQRIETMTGGKMRFEGKLQLIADRRTPYRLVSEVLYTASQAGFRRWQLVALAKQPSRMVRRCIGTRSPSYDEDPPERQLPGEKTASLPDDDDDSPSLNLTIAVSYRGFIVAGAGGVLPGPDGSGPTVKCARALEEEKCPLRYDVKTKTWTDGYDYPKLKETIAKIKAKYPLERRVIVSADRRIPYQVAIRTLDALRGEPSVKCTGEDGCMFDEVILSAGVQ